MKYLGLIGLLLVTGTSSYAMGRKPADPATYGDIQDIQTQVAANQAQEQADTTNLQDQINTLNEKQVNFEGVLRLYDGEYTAFELYNTFDVAHGREVAIGSRFTVKVGKSYEDREIENLRREIHSLVRINGSLLSDNSHSAKSPK